jgi:hypothetical protein
MQVEHEAQLLAEFDSPEHLARAVAAISEKDIPGLTAYTPYSTEAVREALGRGRSPLSFLIAAAGFIGAGAAYFLQWYLVDYLYPLNVGGRPPHMPLAFVPITFEMGVLSASFMAFFGVLFGGRLIRLWHPVFEAEGFDSASIDKFWIGVPTSGEAPERDRLERQLVELGAARCLLVHGFRGPDRQVT